MSLMDGLAGWLKQIVAVVLLASLVDLLLPNRTMQRYVRLVAGLFVLLTVATPLFKWMQADFSGKLAAELEKARRPAPIVAGDQLDRIQQEGRKLREKQTADAGDLVAVRLAEAMRADIEQNEHRQVRKVDVKVDIESDGGISVQQVTVTLAAEVDGRQTAQGDSHTVSPVTKVEPVAPVVVGKPSNNGPDEPVFDTHGESSEIGTVEPDRPTSLRISAFLAARYGIPSDRVIVAESAPIKE